jgi:predicted nucleic acid-binding protein
MIAYVDSSVLLRIVLGQPDALTEWPTIRQGVASALVMTESLRTLDRLRMRTHIADEDIALRRATILELLTSVNVVDVDQVILERAAQPMPTELGTLDAIHLATALLWRDMTRNELVMATHDAALAVGARAHGLRVVGVPVS